ncbi:unnamed protein product [Protopolystoma xenopodis]|uniref:Uncharacterized protein n=1 Tax=Protopolystoma xenopodis TaxID=117903 RepID=A0A3S5C4Q6_9PLAT|nr:unnamed protein product [Protopolystoma xenopodis]
MSCLASTHLLMAAMAFGGILALPESTALAERPALLVWPAQRLLCHTVAQMKSHTHLQIRVDWVGGRQNENAVSPLAKGDELSHKVKINSNRQGTKTEFVRS